MPILEIDGRKVEVDDGFLSLTPEQQNATVDEIAASLGPAQESQQSQALRSELSGLSTKMGGGTIENLDKARYDALPEWKKPLVAAGDTMELMADGATFGFGNKAAAALRAPFTDKSYAEELEAMRAQTERARNRAGAAGTAAEIVGSLAIPGAAANRGATLAGRLGTAGMTGAGGVVSRAGLMAAEGAGYGALGAAGHDTDMGTGAALGALGGAAGSVVGDSLSAGLTKASKTFKSKPDVPSLEKLKASARQAYDKADDAGVIIAPAGLQRLSADVKADLAEFGYHPQLQPRVAVVLNEMDRLSQGNVTLKGVDVMRRIADSARKSLDPTEKAIGNQIIAKIDDFIETIQPNEVITGDAVKGGAALREARSLWSRVRKNERFLDAVERASLRAASTGSGGNVENATRQNIRGLLEKGRGFSMDEKALMEEIVRGTPGQNVLRLAGKLSPSGNGLMAALGVGGAMVNPLVGAASLGGMAAKTLADKGVMRGVQALDELIRSGGDAAALQAAQGALAQLTQAQREAVGRLVMQATNVSAIRNQPSQ